MESDGRGVSGTEDQLRIKSMDEKRTNVLERSILFILFMLYSLQYSFFVRINDLNQY